MISMLGFSHEIKQKDLIKTLEKYESILCKFILQIDKIKNDSKVYKYDHHDLLYNYKLIKYIHKVDQLRSLFFLEIG